VIKALEAGKHILGDKPLCTRPDEIRRIRALAQAQDRKVIVALTLRYTAAWQTARRLIREGAIGEVCTATVHGQHPLNYKAGRPEWYFEKGRHGGTVCDLMIHGIDSLLYLTGSPVAEVVAARAWHKEPVEAPCFQDCAQALLRLANNAGAMMEASYKVPKGHPAPWSAQFWGTLGALDVNTAGVITLKRAGEAARSVEAAVERKGNCVEDFLAACGEMPGRTPELTTADSLDAAEKAVLAQAAADEGRAHQRV
jgi:predicted dehydrogenase